jgi:hypothetical protein
MMPIPPMQLIAPLFGASSMPADRFSLFAAADWLSIFLRRHFFDAPDTPYFRYVTLSRHADYYAAMPLRLFALAAPTRTP